MDSTRTEAINNTFPPEIKSLPQVEIPVDGVTGYCLQNQDKQVVFFRFDEGVSFPDHSHCGQRGMIIEGEMIIEIDGQRGTPTVFPGASSTVRASPGRRPWWTCPTLPTATGSTAEAGDPVPLRPPRPGRPFLHPRGPTTTSQRSPSRRAAATSRMSSAVTACRASISSARSSAGRP